MMPSEFFAKKKKELEDNKNKAYPKIANTFIENVITKSNENALKIVWYLSMNIKKNNVYRDENKRDIKTYRLNTKEIKKETNLDLRTIMKYLKTMQKTTISFINEQEEYEEYIQLIPRIKNNHDGTIDYDVYDVIAKMIIDVADETSGTYIDVRRLLQLKNKHSIRLLPLLEKINTNDGNSLKQKTVNLQYLNSLFGTKYKRYSYIINKILIPVKEELDNNSTLTFTFKVNRENLQKIGKPPIVSITIIPKVNNNYQTTIFTNFEKQEETQEQSLSDEIQENIVIASMISNIPQAIKEQQRVYLEERLHEFIEWVESVDNAMLNKLRKDWNKSFDRHISGYEKNLNKLDRRL